MKTTNYFVFKLVSLLIVVVISGCASLQDQKQEAITTVLSADGSPISFAVKGTGEPTIVFVHCWTCDHKFWQHQIEYFSKRYTESLNCRALFRCKPEDGDQRDV